MQAWEGWPLERLIYLFIGAAYLLAWIQLTIYHWKGAFHHKAMWAPVLLTPLIIIVALAAGFFRGDSIRQALLIAMGLGLLEGLIGTVLHSMGVAKMVGGFNLRNFAAGPPVILALIYAALGGFGLITLKMAGG